MVEPGRFRQPRSGGERSYVASDDLRASLYPASATARIFITHTRPEPMLGVLQTLQTGPERTAALGFKNRGGTLTVDGLLFINGCSWAHVLLEAARVLGQPRESLLTADELAALDGLRTPEGVII
jgi:phosphoketolase